MLVLRLVQHQSMREASHPPNRLCVDAHILLRRSARISISPRRTAPFPSTAKRPFSSASISRPGPRFGSNRATPKQSRSCRLVETRSSQVRSNTQPAGRLDSSGAWSLGNDADLVVPSAAPERWQPPAQFEPRKAPVGPLSHRLDPLSPHRSRLPPHSRSHCARHLGPDPDRTVRGESRELCEHVWADERRPAPFGGYRTLDRD